jgi:two-component system, NtrC family, response regulator AtoC
MTASTRLICDQESLFAGLSTLLRALLYPSQADKTVCSSFELAAKGLGVTRGGLFLIRHTPASPRLEVLCSVGLSREELQAVEGTKDPADARASQIWKMIATQIDLDGEALEPIQRVSPHRYVVALPISDPILEVPVAVLYFEKEAPSDPQFEALAKEWVNIYRLALSQIIHLGFPGKSTETESTDASTGPGPTAPVENAPQLVGESVHTQALRRELHEVHIIAASVPDPDPILILGEKGTGKDLVARYIFAYSARRHRPYVAVNCAEITDEMATARFFGHKKGSFTGSLASEPGLFRAADHGVLFLDEISDLSLRSQGTLLRVLENRTVVPLGETKELRIDVQVILATNCDPEQAIAEGRMRSDLFDRFRTDVIRLAPLRERPWDIPALVSYFIAYHEKRAQKKILGLHPEVLKIMVGYSWPGNVRELARVCSLLITHAKAGTAIDVALLTRLVPHIAREEWNPKAGGLLLGEVPMREAVETFGRELILARLRQHNWNIKSARESLGLPKTTFHRYARALGIAGPAQGEAGIVPA